MFTLLTSLWLAASPSPSSLAQPPLDDDCTDVRRLQLSPPVLSPPRICISPGTLTGVLFDQPVAVELQDEVRFAEVVRGREFIGFIPPRDLLPQEPLRLTAVLGTGEARQSLTLVLVSHPGQGSHQVEVKYTERSSQWLSDALGQALLVNGKQGEELAAIQTELTRVRAQLVQRTGLCGAWSDGQLSVRGVQARSITVIVEQDNQLELIKVTTAVSYRGEKNIAVEVLLTNQTQDLWSLEKATLISEQGETREALRFRQDAALLPEVPGKVFVEFDRQGLVPGDVTLKLSGTGGQVSSLHHVVFP